MDRNVTKQIKKLNSELKKHINELEQKGKENNYTLDVEHTTLMELFENMSKLKNIQDNLFGI